MHPVDLIKVSLGSCHTLRAEIDQLLVFFQIARLGSFTQAAKALYLTQPAVSAQVARLEQRLKVKLVERVGHKLFLTPAGHLLYSYAGQVEQFCQLLDQAAEALAEADSRLVGKVSIGASNTIGVYVLPPVMGQFRKEYPDVELALAVGPSRTMAEGLLGNLYDFVCIEGPTKSTEIVAEHFMGDELCLIVGRDHPWCKRTIEGIALRELRSQQLIGHRPGSGTMAVIEREFQRQNLTISFSMVIDNPEAVKKMVEAGLGVSVVSRLILHQEVERGGLVIVPIRDANLSRGLKTAWRRGKQLSRAARSFLSFLHRQAGDGPV